MAVAAMKPKNAIESLRDVVQDLLVPELKAIKVELESLRMEMRLRDENQSRAINGLAEEMRLRDERQTHTWKTVSDAQNRAIQNLSDKLSVAIEARERLAVLEDRLPRA